MWYDVLPHVNAGLNLTSFLFLSCGWLAIRRKRIGLHATLMVSALGSSTAFLASYLTYHYFVHTTPFHGPSGLRPIYLGILLTHSVLAACVPPLALRTLYLALRNRLESHRRIARWTLPIWAYVSVTGVVVYFMLYWLGSTSQS